MSRLNAILFVALASLASPAFSAEPPPGTTIAEPAPEEIDPATGFSRSTEVRPLRDAPLPPDTDARPPPALAPRAARAHIALILPTASPALGRLADAVRQGFLAAAQAA